MSRPIQVRSLQVTCRNCSNKYDLSHAVSVADSKNTKKVICPHCGEKVAKS
jgi:DNA-directed RNA polymerase subunit RPC12/RpoP